MNIAENFTGDPESPQEYPVKVLELELRNSLGGGRKTRFQG